jgi:hypothetical protein
MRPSLAKLQEAFAVAHKASQNPEHTDHARREFRLLAHLIWRACGAQWHSEAAQ